MKVNAGFATALLSVIAAHIASAAPAPEPATLQARSDLHVYACTDANWSGNCNNFAINANECFAFPSGYQDDISSIGPDAGWLCLAWVDIDCYGYSFYLRNPGESDLSTRSDNVNDQLSAISCWWTGA